MMALETAKTKRGLRRQSAESEREAREEPGKKEESDAELENAKLLGDADKDFVSLHSCFPFQVALSLVHPWQKREREREREN